MADLPNVQLPQTVQVISPDGTVGSIPAHQLEAAQAQGYQFASPSDVQQIQNEEKYGGLGEQAKTFAEGAARGATFGLSSGVERALGVNPEDIRGRQEANPISSMVGEGAGIVGSAFVPVAGAANIAAHVGEGAVSAAAHVIPALADANLVGKIGSAAVKGAIENAVFAGGNEVSKAILEDPNQSFQTALTDVGLSGLIGAGAGGAFGAVNPLWEATIGSRVQPLLEEIRSRASGNMLGISREAQEAVDTLGKTLSPEARAMYAENPAIRSRALELAEGGTAHSDAMRTAISEHLTSLDDNVARVFQGGENKTAAELGEIAAKQIDDRVSSAQAAFNERYDALTPTETAIKVSDDDRLALHDKVRELGQKVEELELGAPNGPVQKAIESFAARVVEPETIKGFDLLRRELGELRTKARIAGDASTAQGYKHIEGILDNFQDHQIAKASKELGAGGLEHADALGRDIVKERQQLRKDYAAHKDEMRDLAEIAGLGRGASTAGRIEQALEKKSSERLASTLFDPKNIKKLNRFEELMPEAFKTFKESYKKKIFTESLDSHGELSQTKLFNKISKIPKEVQSKVFSPGELKELKAVQTLRSEFPDRMNPSGTARAGDGLKKHAFAGLGAIIGGATGHNPILGALGGELAQYMTRELPDAVKLSLIKFLGSSGPVDASAWKTAADLIERTYKGQKLIESATKNVFRAGKAVIPESLYPDEKKTERLDKKLKELAQNPEALFDVGGKTGHYMPEHAQAMGSVAAGAVSWLNEQRPKQATLGVLDEPPPIPKEVSDHYTRTLQIAEQPLVSLEHLKAGTLQPADVQTVQTLYPALYKKLSQGLVSEMISAKSAGTPLDYHTRLGLSMFLAQPLDGTMTPEGIQTLQTAHMQSAQQQAGVQAQQAGSLKALADAPNRSLTPGQSREASHQA